MISLSCSCVAYCRRLWFLSVYLSSSKFEQRFLKTTTTKPQTQAGCGARLVRKQRELHNNVCRGVVALNDNNGGASSGGGNNNNGNSNNNNDDSGALWAVRKLSTLRREQLTSALVYIYVNWTLYIYIYIWLYIGGIKVFKWSWYRQEIVFVEEEWTSRTTETRLTNTTTQQSQETTNSIRYVFSLY